MSDRLETFPAPLLQGTEGELVSVWVAVEPRLLEELLEALATVPFPINPQIYHQPETRSGDPLPPRTLVEFPAYTGRLKEVRAALSRHGLDQAPLTVRSVLADLRPDLERPVMPEFPGVTGRAAAG